jgi:hypothetical protein
MDSWFNPACDQNSDAVQVGDEELESSGFGAVPEVSVSSSCSSNPRPYRVTNRFEPQRANWRLLRLSLIWGPVQGYSKANAGQGFVYSISFCVSHELTEAISDPDGQGYSSKVNGYEIADICEPAAIGEIIITQNLS